MSVRLLALASTLTAPTHACADGSSKAGIVARLSGEATVARPTLAQPMALGLRDDVFLRDEIRTHERSLVHVLMGGKALLTVRELSVLKVTEDTGRVTVDLLSGKIGLAVVRQRMKPGERIEIRSPNTIAAVRGTVLVMEIVRSPVGSGSGGNVLTTNVHLLHGALDVSLRSNPGAPPVSLQSLQTVAVSGNTLGSARAMSNQEAAAITGDLKAQEPARAALPEEFTSVMLKKEFQNAAAVATALTNNGPGHGPAGKNGKSKDKDKTSDKDKNKDKHAGKDKSDDKGKDKGHGKDRGDDAGKGTAHSHGKKDSAADLVFDSGSDDAKGTVKGKDSSSASGNTFASGPTGGTGGASGFGSNSGGVSGIGGGSGVGGGTAGGGGSMGGMGGGGRVGGVGGIGGGNSGGGNGLGGLINLIPPGHLKKGKDK